MKTRYLFLVVLALIGSIAFAALPPRYQNEKDLDVMVRFVKDHPRVLSALDFIDFKSFTIYYRPHCRAIFERKEMLRAPGWVGPAAPLEFEKSTCPID